jgi:hypothetical protein
MTNEFLVIKRNWRIRNENKRETNKPESLPMGKPDWRACWVFGAQMINEMRFLLALWMIRLAMKLIPYKTRLIEFGAAILPVLDRWSRE